MMNKYIKIIFTLIFCVLLLITITPRAKVVYELSLRKTNLEQGKQLLIEKNQVLTKEFEQAGSIENVERIAREQLGMVKNGEQVIMPVISNNN